MCTWKEIVCKFYLMNFQILPWIYQNSNFVQNHLIIYSKLKWEIKVKEINYSCLKILKLLEFTRNVNKNMVHFELQQQFITSTHSELT